MARKAGKAVTGEAAGQQPGPKKPTAKKPAGKKPKPEANQQPAWKHGTDLREDGIYAWPHTSQLEEGQEQVLYPSVTTVLDMFFGGGMRHAEAWFTAQYVHELTMAAVTKTPVMVWLDTDNVDGGESVQVAAIDILKNSLPRDSFGKNFGMHWVKKAGAREMRKRANRGSVMHDALEEWAYGQRIDSGDVGDYTTHLTNARGFALARDYVEPYVRQLLLWCDRHIVDVAVAETMVMSDTYSHAGTMDLGLKIRGYSDVPEDSYGILDAKSSKEAQASHEMQDAAYFFSEWVTITGTNERAPMPRFEWAANIYVQPEQVTLKRWPRIYWPESGSPLDCEPYRDFVFARALWQSQYTPEKPRRVKPVNVAPPSPSSIGLPDAITRQGQLPI